MTSVWTRASRRWLAALVLCLAAACARRAPVAPGALAYPEYAYPADRDDASAVSAKVESGWQALQRGDLRAAGRDVRAAVTQAPQSVSARTALGYVNLASRQSEGALREFDAALERRVRFVPALVGRGYALSALNREADALAAFEAALAINASLQEVRRQADVLRLRAVQGLIEAARGARKAGRLDDARARYARAIEASPESAFLYRERAALEREQGRHAAALPDLRKAAALEPADVDGLTSLGGTLAALGNVREAERAYRQAYAIDPSDAIGGELERLSARARDSGLPEEFRAIGTKRQLTRGELAALLGVRFDALLRTVATVQLVMTDVRTDWARPWIASVAGAGVMEPYANHTFQPAAPALRADLAMATWRLLALASTGRPAVRAFLSERPRIADLPQTHPLYTAAAAAAASGAMPLDGTRFEAARALSGSEATAVVARLTRLVGE
jgi:tetratricopeptide (TPR) repeat protein